MMPLTPFAFNDSLVRIVCIALYPQDDIQAPAFAVTTLTATPAKEPRYEQA